MKKLILKNRVALAGVFCIAASACADDFKLSSQDYLDAVNSEARRIEPYLIPLKTETTELSQHSNQDTSVEGMIRKLKKLTAHAND